MDETFLHRIEQLISARAGLQLRPREREALRGTLAARMAALHLRHAEEYHQLLQAGTPDAESEWEHLLARVTNKESYFFRDKGQMALLRERLLPELIARNQATRTLRLWSAGCSTGEEPYSLAMLVNELLPQRQTASGAGWEIVILGTDIDGPALEQAKRGIYGSWSFRVMEPGLQQRSFQRREDGWQVAEASRSLVTFGRCNLVADPFPGAATGIHDMDLILCRNVFIYFEREAVSAVLRKFGQTLRDGGYLMTGHSETYGRLMEPLQARMFPGSVVYQRADKASIGVETAPNSVGRETGTGAEHASIRSPLPAPTHTNEAAPTRPLVSPLPVSPVVQQVETAVSRQPVLLPAAQPERAFTKSATDSVSSAAARMGTQTQEEPAGERALLLRAVAHANLGQYEDATGCCRRLIKEHPLAPEPYEVLASIAQEQGNDEEAKALLKKALYLAPASPSAYLELGALYRSEGDEARARKMYVTALELLLPLPPDAAIGAFGGPNAQEWILHLKQLPAEGE